MAPKSKERVLPRSRPDKLFQKIQMLGTDGWQGGVLNRTATMSDRIRDNADGLFEQFILRRILALKPETQPA